MKSPRVSDVQRQLLRRAQDLLAQPPAPVVFANHPAADRLLNDLEANPHAFVLGCLMDRQIKAERAWVIPYLVQKRLNCRSFQCLTRRSPDDFLRAMTAPNNLHRFPKAMAQTFSEGVHRIKEVYGGDASDIWARRPSSATLVRRFLEFRGAGPKIATMAANILVRDFRIAVSDRFSIDISPDVQVRRVFGRLGLMEPDGSIETLIYTARGLNPEYPGIFDLSAWEIGRNWCRPRRPRCELCPMKSSCPSARV